MASAMLLTGLDKFSKTSLLDVAVAAVSTGSSEHDPLRVHHSTTVFVAPCGKSKRAISSDAEHFTWVPG
jgi:hypothetical protein